MEARFIEAVQAMDGPGNWGKFCVARFTGQEWQWPSAVDQFRPPRALLAACGWDRHHDHVWVMDLQTGEAAYVRPGGSAHADLDKHRVWVCPLFEPFLEWLYVQDLSDLQALPSLVELPGAEFAFAGYRRPGKQ